MDYPLHRAGRQLFLPRGQPPGVFRQQDARCGRKGRDKRERSSRRQGLGDGTKKQVEVKTMSITGAYTWEDISSLGMEAYFQPIYNVESTGSPGLRRCSVQRDRKGVPRPGGYAGGRGTRLGA